MRIVVTGAKGMLGFDLVPVLKKKHEVVGVDIEDFDIVDSETIKILEKFHPEIICHLAAYTDVDGCEMNEEKALSVNGIGTRNVALACKRMEIPILYVSTDYVFDGAKSTPYYEWDVPNPISVYGRSKLVGEQIIEWLLKDFYIVRTSWLVGKCGKNFVETILSKAKTENRLEVVGDQVGSPTFTFDLSLAIAQLIKSELFGIYHITNSGFCSWFEFAKEIIKEAGIKEVEVVEIDSKRLSRPAKRPLNSVLRNFFWEKSGGESLPHWKESLRKYLSLE